MTDFKNLVSMRRSHRDFTEEPLNPDDVKLILRAALMSPTSKSRRAWHFVVVEDKTDIEKLADAKPMGAQFLKKAPLVVVVLGDMIEDNCWIEDSAVAAYSMQLQAEDLGLGSCWTQMRGRSLSDGTLSEDIIRGVLNIPEKYGIVCIIAFGHKKIERKIQNDDKLKWENVHIDKF